MKLNSLVIMEWCGVITAIGSTLLIAFNIGAELIGFSLLFISVFLIALWFYKKTQRYFIITIILYQSSYLRFD